VIVSPPRQFGVHPDNQSISCLEHAGCPRTGYRAWQVTLSRDSERFQVARRADARARRPTSRRGSTLSPAPRDRRPWLTFRAAAGITLAELEALALLVSGKRSTFCALGPTASRARVSSQVDSD
jgi:hypothetical protein